MNNSSKLTIVKRAAIALREHFDSVHIVAVCQDEKDQDASVRFSSGAGSWYERFGAILETANEMSAQTPQQQDPDD